MQNYKTKIIQITLWIAFATTFISGQKTEKTDEIIKVETNAVFVETLVRDKATGKPVSDLQREDFTLKVDNKPREIVEFSFDGKTNCPLTIILHFNFAPNGALRYLEQPKTRKSLRETLEKLNENDKVAVMTTQDWFVGKPKLLLAPTRNWEEVLENIAEATNNAVLNGQNKPKPDQINKSTMTDAIAEVERITAEKPEQEIAFVYISDGVNSLDTMTFSNRKQLAERLLKSNISFSALNFDLLNSYSVAANIINPLAFAFGASVTGSANYLAKESGGASIKVEKAEDFGVSLEAIINLYSSRYSLGFYLNENERADGTLHKLEVKVKNNNKRNLLISARRGFYINR